ncbi:MAG: FtsH protease activity modulator HflK [Pirellulaceae bacterium]
MKKTALLLLACVVAYGATGLYFVQPDEQAMVRRFGRALDVPRGPGAHFGLPWGWDRVDRIKPREIKRVTIGPLRLGGEAVGASAAEFLTGDRNLVIVRSTVQYSIREPKWFLYQTLEVDRLVARTGEAALTGALSSQPVDLALTRGKQELGTLVRRQLQSLVDQYGLGITIRSVDIGSVAPPSEVAEAFDNVISALRQRDQQINQSYSYVNRTLAQAQASAQRLRNEARGRRDRWIQEAVGSTARFEKLLAEYVRAPSLTARRLYLETMAEILPRFRSKLIVDDGENLDLSIIGQRDESPSP